MKKQKKIVIFGSGGHGKVILDILQASGCKVIGFIDENTNKHNKTILGIKVLGGWEYLLKNNKVSVALGIGDNKARGALFQKLQSLKIDVVSALHPQAVISRYAQLEKGVVVMAGAVINPSAVLNDGVVVNTGASVDHDCFLDAFSQVYPGAHLAGTVHVGAYSAIGIGASAIQNIKIGDNVIIGAGAAVISDVPGNVIAVGVPAKIIKKR